MRKLARQAGISLVSLLGVLAGGALCVHYLRSEIAADIGPQLKRMQNQLDNIESALNLALATRYAELSRTDPGGPQKHGQQSQEDRQ